MSLNRLAIYCRVKGAVWTFSLLVTLLAVSPANAAGPEQVIHAFMGRDGALPESLVADHAGNLYGVANIAGDPASSSCAWSVGTGCGTVFELSPSASGRWITTILHRFTGTNDGSGPVDLVMDSGGNLFGVTQQGGGNGCSGNRGCGILFELSPTANGWKFERLHTFTGGIDGSTPVALALDAAGSLYVSLASGGNSDCGGLGCGTIFRMAHTPSGWKGHTIHIFDWTFTNQTASNPHGRVAFDTSGNLYGAAGGGTFNNTWSTTFGVIYRLAPSASGQWKETDIFDFCPDPQVSCDEGSNPLGGPILDSSGNLFGTTLSGGSIGSGTVFQLTPTSSDAWTIQVLYSFTGGSDGGSPVTPITLNSRGELLGTTAAGGDPNCACGVLFQVSPASGAWLQRVLHSFSGGFDGNNPSSSSGLVLDSAGHIFGTATYGGVATGSCQSLCGVVYEYGSSSALH